VFENGSEGKKERGNRCGLDDSKQNEWKRREEEKKIITILFSLRLGGVEQKGFCGENSWEACTGKGK